MSQVDKIKVGDTSYEVSASPEAATAFDSQDEVTPSVYSQSSPITSGETTSNLLNKISIMFRNIRYLYSILGTGFSSGNTLTSQMNDKLSKNSSVTTAQMPTSNVQTNSTSFVPTSSLLYSMNQTLEEINDKMRTNVVNIPTVSGTLTFNGSTQSPSWNGYDPAKMTMSGVTSGVDAGTYKATFIPGTLYKWPDGTHGAAYVNWSIGRAAGKVTCNPSSVVLDKDHKTSTSKITRLGDGALSAVSNWAGVGAVMNGDTVNISSIDDQAGSGTIMVSAAQSKNYEAATGSISVTSKFKDMSDPNTRYKPGVLVATLNNPTDTRNFFKQYNKANNYTGLALGNEIQINDGTYNQRWIIAGFDCEKDHMASDGTVKDNGYGIFLIPKTSVGSYIWNDNDTTNSAYANSQVHGFMNREVSNNLRIVLSDNLIRRNVLLSTSTSNGNSASYSWQLAYATLMSAGQLTGEFGMHNNQYDDGEANYKLPVFNYMDKKTGSYYWLRGIQSVNHAWDVGADGIINNHAGISYGAEVRPLIMISEDTSSRIPPNERYDSAHTLIATLNNTTDTTNFCNAHNKANNYTGLALGQEIQINNDGFNARWVIAGFDCEHNHQAADGTTKDNGYGIFLVPKTQLDNHVRNSNVENFGGYTNSEIHGYCAGTVTNNLKKTLGSHLINRNVLLSTSTSAYQWTTTCATLMPIGQMTGTFGKNNNKYDDGEANYKLPVFNYMDKKTGSAFWSRGGNITSAWRVNPDGSLGNDFATNSSGVRPLIMIR